MCPVHLTSKPGTGICLVILKETFMTDSLTTRQDDLIKNVYIIINITGWDSI